MFTLPLRDYPFNEGKSQFHWEAYIQMVTMRWHQPHVSTPGWPTCSWQFFVSKLLEMERAYPLKASVSTTKVPNISNILRPTSIFVVTLNRISIRFWNSKAWKRMKIGHQNSLDLEWSTDYLVQFIWFTRSPERFKF